MAITRGRMTMATGSNPYVKNPYAKPTKALGSTIPVGPPVAPAIISRVPVFQPRFKNVPHQRYEQTTPWGTVVLEGHLGGIHRKVLDALFATAIKEQSLETGAKALVVDLYQVAKMAHVDHKPKWILGLLKDMQTAEIEITDGTTGLRHWGSIISEFWESQHRVPQPGGALQGTRPYYVITISAAWMKIYDTSVVVKYRALLPDLNRIRDGATHALALHILTHQDHVFAVDDTLAHVGAFPSGISDRRRRQIRDQVLGESETLAVLGIHLYRQSATEQLMASYHHRPDVHFQSPSES